ncbi:unnamed protein product, partial [Prorocentrum cordatum]
DLAAIGGTVSGQLAPLGSDLQAVAKHVKDMDDKFESQLVTTAELDAKIGSIEAKILDTIKTPLAAAACSPPGST